MSDQMTVGDYSLEISGDEVIVRDESGTIVETVDLDEVKGQLTLPDGQQIDLAAVLSDSDLDAFRTAAGAANDNTAVIDGSASFTHLQGTQDELGGLSSAGALSDTVLTFDALADIGPAPGDYPVEQQSRSSFDWSQHESGSGQTGNSGHAHHPSAGDRSEDDDDGVNVDFPPRSDRPSQDNNQPGPAEGNDEPSTPPTDEHHQPPANENQGDEPSTPPADEQQQPPVNEDENDEPSTPPADEQQQPPVNEDESDEPSTPPADEQQPPVNEDESDEPSTPPADEQQQPPVNEDESDEPSTPPADEQQQPPVNEDESDEPSTPPADEQQQQPVNEDESDAPSTPPADEQQSQPADENQDDESSTPPADDQQQSGGDEGQDEGNPPPQQQQLVNSAPTDLDLANKSVVENTSGAIIGTLTVVDPDAGDTHSFTVSDDRFEVANGQLKLKDGVSLDFETAASLDITVTATDKAGNQYAEIFTIGVTNVNEAPTAVHLSNHNVNENAAGAVIGMLTTDDPDVGDTFSYQVSDSRFQVVNGQLQLKSGILLDHETEPTVTLDVTSTDKGGLSTHQSFTIDVANVNEKPVALAVGGTFHSGSLQPTVDFSDVDSTTLSKAVIHTTGFQSGDVLNIPTNGNFNVTVNHGTADYTITIVGKTGQETVEQYEDFANSISFSTNNNSAGARHIEYSVTDSGGLTSNVSSADIAVAIDQQLHTSLLGKGQTTVGAGNDTLYIDTKSFSPVDMGDGYDTVHLAQQGRSFNHQDAIKLNNVEAIDATGYGNNNVSLSIHDVLNMTDGDNHLTIIGDAGDSVTLTNSGSTHHWTVVESNASFTTYAYSDPSMQAVVEISNQMNAQVS